MKGRLVTAALAALMLTGCPPTKKGDQAYLLEKDGHYAIGINHGDRTEVFPLPDDPTVIINGVSQGIQQVMVMPKCPCTRQDCQIFCRPWDPGQVTPRKPPPPPPTREPVPAPVPLPPSLPATTP